MDVFILNQLIFFYFFPLSKITSKLCWFPTRSYIRILAKTSATIIITIYLHIYSLLTSTWVNTPLNGSRDHKVGTLDPYKCPNFDYNKKRIKPALHLQIFIEYHLTHFNNYLYKTIKKKKI